MAEYSFEQSLDAVETDAVNEIVATHLLHSRHSRNPDFQAESASLEKLVERLRAAPLTIAQEVVHAALELTHAHSAGLSLEQSVGDAKFLRWVETTGEFKRYTNMRLPRNSGPCGIVLNRNEHVLLQRPASRYTFLSELHVPTEELLLVPFRLRGVVVGVLWVATHTDEKTFEQEDLRLLKNISLLAAATMQQNEHKNAVPKAEALLPATAKHVAMLEEWFQNSPSFIALVRGPRHIVEMANDAYFALVGPRDLIGKPLFDTLDDVRGQGFEELLNEVFLSGKPYVARDARVLLRRHVGAEPLEMFLDFVFQPMTDEVGKISGVCIQGHDVTTRHVAMEALESADRSKDDFLAMLAHELRNPLSPIKTSIEAFKRLLTNTDQRQQRLLGVIERQTNQITALVNDLMDVASVRSGKVRLDRSPISLQICIDTALESSQAFIEARKHRLDVQVPQEPLIVSGDMRRVAQVITNLVNNAAKYTPDGGVITLLAEANDTHVKIRVIDNGIGIAPKTLPKIFELFLQAPEAAFRAFGGLGIGLALVKKLVELHDGTVTAYSAGENQGSEFTVTLPRLVLQPQLYDVAREIDVTHAH